MYALFPNEARTYLSKHRTSEKVDFLLEEESSQTKEEDYVDINQIRELVRVAEESGVGEIVVEEEARPHLSSYARRYVCSTSCSGCSACRGCSCSSGCTCS